MAQKKTAVVSKSTSSRKKARNSDEQEQYTKALGGFERAVKLLQKRDIKKAQDQLSSFLSNFPEEKAMAERARTYLTFCERQLATKTVPRQLEELVAQGVFCHNRGEYDEAIKYLAKAVEMEPKNDHVHYCLASAYARVGDSRGASRHLKRAIASDPYNRVLAKRDGDFQTMRNDPSLADLLKEEATGAAP
jgi:tetratricopeptide (TPR) repeat protein